MVNYKIGSHKKRAFIKKQAGALKPVTSETISYALDATFWEKALKIFNTALATEVVKLILEVIQQAVTAAIH